MAVTAYNAKDCTVAIDDTYITCLSETFISGEKDEENFSTAVGAQGDVCVSEMNNPLGTITLTVQATCPQKSYLLALAEAGTVFPIWVTNRSIGERMGGTQARIKKSPSVEYAQEAGEREFEIAVFDYVVQTIE